MREKPEEARDGEFQAVFCAAALLKKTNDETRKKALSKIYIRGGDELGVRAFWLREKQYLVLKLSKLFQFSLQFSKYCQFDHWTWISFGCDDIIL